MTTVVLYVGIAVAFLTVWGVIMVGAYLLGDETDDAPTAVPADWVSDTPAAEGARLR
ncbi:MAG: hypothetical protein ABI862_15300 [Ilumatobacteraceae bacterium]